MTSQDNAMDITRLELLLREHFARTDKQLSDFRAENAEFHTKLMKEMSDFKTEIRQEMNDFKTDLRQEMNDFRTEIRHDIKELRADVVELQKDVVGLKHDVEGLYHWNYWLLSVILVVFAMPQIVAGIKSLFTTVAEGISAIAGAFRKENRA
ncbi:MAG: hypothetical protein IJR27_01610 [Synergistaceae bacterium]|nr:hypothetical protein [Synergistaceae bacterium]